MDISFTEEPSFIEAYEFYIDTINSSEGDEVERLVVVEEVETSIDNDNINEIQYSDCEIWDLLIRHDITTLKKPIEYLLLEFGTSEPCNRFDVGNSIEFILCDYIESCGLKVNELPNAKRFDLDIPNYKKLSIKYSSTGDITLHNSNSCINTDIEMKDTILLTPDGLYLLTDEELKKNNINIADYIQNNGDSLKLKRKIIKELHKINYPYIYNIHIEHDKINCKNRLCSKVFYKEFMKEYTESIK
tara:strand:+ start:108 stop:842 length:735 start_codon:yes stop_codon:yes gene_type:complete